ncbi:MAG: AAA family ATPase, partial [Firmicutes bacterium]|nr:AAA family ATPase [Bacillota bacterium]
MNQNESKVTERNEELEIDLQRLFEALIKRIWMIVLAAVLGGLLSFGVTYYLITPEYESTAMFYVNNGSLSVGSASINLSSSDLSVSKSLVDSYIVILKTRETLEDVADYVEVDISYGDLKEMIHASAVNSTEIFEVVVTSTDPAQAEDIADAISYILPKRISNIVEGTSAEIVDHAVLPSKPSSPNIMKNTALGLILGFVLCVGAICIYEIFNITIRSEEDVEQCCSYPVLTVVPDMRGPSKGGYYRYAYENEKSRRSSKKKKAGKKKLPADGNELAFIGKNLGFAASEAYKMLAAKIQFSFADDQDNHVICVSSSLPGEGKSLTSINLAASLAQLNKNVLLVDCDLRKPSMAQKLGVALEPGLSNYLVRQNDISEIVRYVDLDDNIGMNVITAGDIPP